MNFNSDSTFEMRSKRQSFHKQIRSKQREEYITSQRKLLHMQRMRVSNVPQKCKEIHSFEEVLVELSQSFIADYESIAKFLNQRREQRMGVDLQDKIMELVFRPEFLRNQHALMMFVVFINRNDFIADNYLKQDNLPLLVNKVVEENLTLINSQNPTQKINYFTSVCWFLFSLSFKINNKSLLLPLKQYIPLFEQEASTFPYEFIALISNISVISDLQPSESYIIRLMNKTLQQNFQPDFTLCTIQLLDNFIRYCKEVHRFQNKESFNMVLEYIKFTKAGMHKNKIKAQQRAILIKLLSAIIQSSSPQLLIETFNTNQSRDLCQEIYFRASMASEIEQKIQNMICLAEILCHEDLIDKVTKMITPVQITGLVASFLEVNNYEMLMDMLAVTIFLLEARPKIFVPLFRMERFERKIKKMQLFERDWSGISENQHQRPSEIAQMIYENWLKQF